MQDVYASRSQFRVWPAWVAAVVICTTEGCASLGTATIRPDRFEYNTAGAESAKEQLLLNLVRLRYGEPIYFLDVGSMVSQRRFDAEGRWSAWSNDIHGSYGPALRAVYGLRGDASRQTTWGANLSYSDQPTITYTPVQGEKFSQQFMTPIPPATLAFLAKSGWSIDRIFDCCVQQLNDLSNMPIHDSERNEAGDVAGFRRATKLMKELQDAGHYQLSVEDDPEGPSTYVTLLSHTPETTAARQELFTLLGLSADGRIRLVSAAKAREPRDIVVQSRSVLATMYGLAQQIPVPREHCQSHEVGPAPATAPTEDSQPPWLDVQHSRLPQIGAFVQVFYNGYWYYIAKSDWSSKRTFALMTYLLSLQASGLRGGEPLLTIPAGR